MPQGRSRRQRADARGAPALGLHAMSSSEGVGFGRDGSVVTITLARPADQNRLTRDVLETLQGIADRLSGDGEIHVVVITGSGTEFFSMGILNPAVRATYSKEQILELVRVSPTASTMRSRRSPRSSSPRSTASRARERPSWRSRATSAWRRRTRRSPCPRRAGAAFPAPAVPCAFRRSSGVGAR